MGTLTDPPTPPPPAPGGDQSKVTPPPPGGGETPPPRQAVVIPDNWMEALDEDVRGDPALKNFKDIKALAKSYVNAQKLIGADKIPVPGKNASEEDWNNVFAKLGKPGKLEEYKLGLKEDVKLDADTLKQFQEVAFKANLLPGQATKLVEWFAESQAAQNDAYAAKVKSETEKQIGDLKKEWGPDFVARVNMANLALKHYAGEDPDLFKYLDDMGYSDDPKLLKLFAKMGENLKEHGFINGETGKPTRTVADIDAAIAQHMNDPKGPYMNPDHPNHAKAVEDAQKLFQERAALGT
jgi:hypothetical protein